MGAVVMYGYLHLSSEMIQLSAMYIKPPNVFSPDKLWMDLGVDRDKSIIKIIIIIIIIIIITISTNKGKGNIIPFLGG